MKADAVIDYLRGVLPGAGSIREVRMFGGTGFMLNGNMIAGTFRQGLLLRVGKDLQEQALTQPGARLMEMNGRLMAGYVYIDPSALTKEAVQSTLRLALAFVRTLPPKIEKARSTRRKGKNQ